MDSKKDYSGWSELLKKVAFSINLTPTKSLGGLYPFELTRTFPVRSLSMRKIVLPRSKLERDFFALTEIHKKIQFEALQSVLKQRNYQNPQSDRAILTKEEICFRKRMNFSKYQNSKLQAHVIQAVCIKSRVGTGAYRCQDITTGEFLTLPACQLIRSYLSKDQVTKILEEIRRERI
jgi:hypothetical protein